MRNKRFLTVMSHGISLKFMIYYEIFYELSGYIIVLSNFTDVMTSFFRFLKREHDFALVSDR